MAEIVFENVTKVFPGDVVALDDVSLRVADGEFIALVGPSGCGKSTLLRALAGLEEVTSGSISIDGRDVTDLAPRHRDVAMVFQSYALYPHMTVRQNLGYGLKVRRTSKDEIRRRVDEVAAMLGLDDLLERRPAQLSGGQRQRVAMGRAIVRQPKAFLMDEPLSNLDAKLRVGMRASLAQLHRRLGDDDRVRHARPGGGDDARAAGRGDAGRPDPPGGRASTPVRAAARHLRRRVHRLPGDEPRRGDDRRRRGELRAVPRRRSTRPAAPCVALDPSVVLGIRPESFEDAQFASHDLPALDVEVAVLEELGSDAHVFFPVDAPPSHERCSRTRAKRTHS